MGCRIPPPRTLQYHQLERWKVVFFRYIYRARPTYLSSCKIPSWGMVNFTPQRAGTRPTIYHPELTHSPVSACGIHLGKLVDGSHLDYLKIIIFFVFYFDKIRGLKLSTTLLHKAWITYPITNAKYSLEVENEIVHTEYSCLEGWGRQIKFLFA